MIKNRDDDTLMGARNVMGIRKKTQKFLLLEEII